MSSAKRVYLDYRIPKNSGSRHSDFYNEQVRAGHPCELFIQDDGSYKIFVSTFCVWYKAVTEHLFYVLKNVSLLP